MGNRDDNEQRKNSLDTGVARALSVFAQRRSRRGLLAASGKLLLRALGVSIVVPLLPIDRAFAQVQNCDGEWQYCGQWGNFCKACCGVGAQATTCPPCLYQGQSWTTCCCVPACPAGGHYVSYYDCCGAKGRYAASARNACMGHFCGRNPVHQPYWCGPSYPSSSYKCTVVSVSTTACNNNCT